MPSVGRLGRWKGLLVSIGVLGAVVSLALVATYAPMPTLTPKGSLAPPFQFAPARLVEANGSVTGPGGCVGTGSGLTEFCYALQVVIPRSPTGPFNFSIPGPYKFANTSAVTFVIGRLGISADLPFVNVTLLGPSGVLLAGYAPQVGWTPIGGASLPIVVVANDTLVLNFGRASASGDELVAKEGAWGTAIAFLP